MSTQYDKAIFFLKNNPGATSRQIADAYNIPPASVASLLLRACNSGEVVRIDSHPYTYKMAHVAEKIPAAPPSPPQPQSSNIDELAKSIALELAAKIKEYLMQELADLLPVQPHLADIIGRTIVAQPRKVRLPTVVIVGLLPYQAGLIQQQFHDAFDLRFWKDESATQLKSLCKNADYVIAFTGKMGHQSTDIVNSVRPDCITVMGGITRLKDKLLELHGNHINEK